MIRLVFKIAREYARLQARRLRRRFRQVRDDATAYWGRIEAQARQWAEDLEREAERAARDREGALIDDATLGSECAALLASAPVRLYFGRVEAQLVDKVAELAVNDEQGWQQIALALRTLRKLKEYLLNGAQAGRFAEAEIEKLRAGKERRLRSVR